MLGADVPYSSTSSNQMHIGGHGFIVTSPSTMAHRSQVAPLTKQGPYALLPGAPEALSALRLWVQQMDAPVAPLEMKWGRGTKSREESLPLLECCLPPHHGNAATTVSSNDIPPVTSCLYNLRGMALQKVIIT